MRVSETSKWIMTGVLALCSVIGHATENAELPNVLIIGDSISIGYTKPLKTILKSEAQVSHNPKNARDSATGLKNLDAWLGTTKWAVIHFNHGLHDMIQGYRGEEGYVATHTGKAFVPIDEYKSNLEKIVLRLKKTDAKLIFATTTPIPEGTNNWKGKQGYEKEYNKVAIEIMKENNIEINDLHGFVLPKLKQIQKPNDVHFKPRGSEAMAKEVAKYILEAIGQQTNADKK